MASKLRNVMAPGPSKLTLFGTLVKDQLPTYAETNQPLTSDAIHEALHSDNPVVDQYQVEPFYTYRNSYIDEIYAGNFFTGTRVVVGRCTEGTQGTTGSLLRGVRLIDEKERYYDSLMPNLRDYFSRLAISGSVFSPIATKILPVPGYYFSGAFDYSVDGAITFLKANKSLPYPYVGNPKRVVKDNAALIVSSSLNDKRFKAIANYQDLISVVFQHGVRHQKFSNLVKTTAGSTTAEQTITDQKFFGARGFRYGISNVGPQYSAAIFRYDRYGQFRDMLEQRRDTRFWDAGTSDDYLLASAINIKFVDTNNKLVEPIETLSQNLSFFATSSLPYFDENAVERLDDPTKTNAIVISEVIEV